MRMQAKLQITNRDSYAIHELQMPTGAKVREFADHGGKVFAVSWSGGWGPNLRDILGVHYEQFIQGSGGRRVTRGPVRIVLPGMVIVMAGHQRNFFGQVCLTDLLPVGLRPEDVR
jgi:multidrug efflux pump subunit AcrA (membrane-fusion protein)